MKRFLFRIFEWFENLPRYVLILMGKLGVVLLYQPLWRSPAVRRQQHVGERGCQDRWECIEQNLPSNHFSFLDIGSQVGYFTLSAAHKGAFAIGIERDKVYRKLAQAQAALHNLPLANFYNMELNSDSVVLLPEVDVTICLSVYHHWVREWSQEEADKIFSRLCSHTGMMFFETGQCNEKNVDWAADMSFMGADPKAWGIQYLEDKGFDRVAVIGEFPTHLSDVERYLVFATKASFNPASREV